MGFVFADTSTYSAENKSQENHMVTSRNLSVNYSKYIGHPLFGLVLNQLVNKGFIPPNNRDNVNSFQIALDKNPLEITKNLSFFYIIITKCRGPISIY